MNELMIVLKSGGGWLYFKTNQIIADKAFTEFTESCDNAGINVDNISVNFIELRNSNGLAIDSKTF